MCARDFRRDDVCVRKYRERAMLSSENSRTKVQIKMIFERGMKEKFVFVWRFF